jgi:hypothetical protein
LGTGQPVVILSEYPSSAERRASIKGLALHGNYDNKGGHMTIETCAPDAACAADFSKQETPQFETEAIFIIF